MIRISSTTTSSQDHSGTDSLAGAAEPTHGVISDGANSESLVKFLGKNITELANLKYAIASFVVNNLRRRYHNSVVGFGWSLLNPLLTMGVMALIFSLVFHQDPKRFTVYLFGSMLPWTYIVESLVGGSTALTAHESFLKKLYLPKTFFPLVVVCVATCNFLLSMISLLILGFAFGMKPSLSLLLLPLATAVLFSFNFAMALLLAVGTVYLRDLTHLVTVFLGVVFYMMPIIYPIDQMPQEYRGLFLCNPFYYFLCLFRALLYEARIPTAQEWSIPVGISFVALFCALYVLRKKDKDIVYRL
ncbi:MAG: ABC transporter permease [Candidatus Obscuribacterales bacterium]|nr:ABC transporter permease [Candidatus Obscuribacterales bacterium]